MRLKQYRSFCSVQKKSEEQQSKLDMSWRVKEVETDLKRTPDRMCSTSFAKPLTRIV